MEGKIIVKRTPAATTTTTSVAVDLPQAPYNGDSIVVKNPSNGRVLTVVLDTTVTWNCCSRYVFEISGAPSAGADYDAWIA